MRSVQRFGKHSIQLQTSESNRRVGFSPHGPWFPEDMRAKAHTPASRSEHLILANIPAQTANIEQEFFTQNIAHKERRQERQEE